MSRRLPIKPILAGWPFASTWAKRRETKRRSVANRRTTCHVNFAPAPKLKAQKNIRLTQT